MNYYLARDGQTYGPYPEESFAGMFAAGQVLTTDLVCAEGSSEWVLVRQVPAFSSFAQPVPATALATSETAPVAAGGGLRVSTTTAPRASASAPMGGAVSSYSSPAPKTGLLERVATAWGVLKLIAYAVVVLIIAGSIILGYFASQREKKEIAKLQSLPGWKAFEVANSQIESESSNAGYGNNPEAGKVSKVLATAIEAAQRESFVIEKTPRYRGRSKIGRIVSAADAATAGTGHFETFIELRDDRAVVLIHVPEFRRYKEDSREGMRDLCWEAAYVALKPMLKKNKEFNLVVGVRGSSSYDSVYVGNLGQYNSPESHPPRAATDNVASHKLLVKWFGDEKL